MSARLLIIAGSDSGGGAGIQADIKTATAFQVFATTAVTAITAQNTHGVTAVEPVTASLVAQQIDATLSDIGADSIKIGMLANAEIARAVSQAISRFDGPIVLDPVMVATSGDTLLERDAISILRSELIPRATVVTPNLPEFDLLTGHNGVPDDDRLELARQIARERHTSVVLKGGHADGAVLRDWLIDADREHCFENERFETRHTHGTGCTLSTAIACGLARGSTLYNSVRQAVGFVHKAIQTAPGLGDGKGPLNFFIDPFDD